MSTLTPLTRVLFGRCRKAVRLLVLGVFFGSALIASVITVAKPRPAEASTSSYLNFQARLQNASGGIVADGYYNIEFKLYNVSSAGAALWTEDYYDSNGATAGNDNRVRVKNGYISVNLGSQTAFPGTINWDQDLWLTMNVGGTTQTATPTWDGEMNPRLKLTSVPYAFKAGQLAQYNGATGYTSTLSLTAPTGGNQNFVIPDQGAAGTYNLLTTNTANASYIQNTTSVQASSNFNISGNGTIGGNLNVTGNASLIKPGTNSTTAFQIQPAGSTTPVLDVDTTNGRVGIGTAAPGAALEVVGEIHATGPDAVLTLYSLDTSGHYYSLYSASGELSFYNGALEATLSNNGSLGLGLNHTPSYQLDAAGDINTTTQYRLNGTVICTSSGCTPAAGSTNYIQNTTTLQAANIAIQSATTADNSLLIKQKASQSGALLAFQDSSGASLGGVDAYGNLFAQQLSSNDTITATTYAAGKSALYAQQGTASATAPVAIIKGGATPGAGSDLLQLQNSSAQALAGFNNAGQLYLGRAGASGATGSLKLYNATNSNTVTIQSGTTSASYSLTLPTAGPSTGQCLMTDSVTASQLTFGACASSGGVTTVGTFSGTSQANGATISGSTITFGPADGTNPGMVTTGAQTIAGAKTLTGQTIINSTVAGDFALEGKNNSATGYGIYGFANNNDNTHDVLRLDASGGTVFSVKSNGATTISGATEVDNSTLVKTTGTAAFNVQNASGANMLTVDSSHNAVIVGNVASGNAASAALYFGDTCSTFTQTCLKIGEYNGTDSDNLQLHGAAGLTFTTGYATQTITGVLTSTGRLGIGIGNSSPSAALDVQGSAAGVDLLRVTDTTSSAQTVFNIADEGAVTFKNRTDSLTAFQVQNASGTNVLSVDTANKVVSSLDLNVGSNANRSGTGRLFSDGFESGDFSFWSGGATIGGSSTASVDTATVRNGKYSAKLTNNNDAAKLTTSIAATSTTYLRGYFYVTSNTTTGNPNFFTLNNGGGSGLGLRRDSTSNHLVMQWNNGANTSDTGVTLPTNQWNKVELKIVGGTGTAGSITVFLNNVQIATTGGINTTSTTFNTVVVGTGAVATQTIYVDDIGVDSVATGDSTSLNVNDSLHVAGTSSFSGPALFRPSLNSTTALQVQNSSTSTVLDVDTANGYVGIGTSAPATLLHAASGSTSTTLPMFRLEQTASSGYASLELKNPSASFYIGQQTNANSNSNALVVNSSTAAATPTYATPTYLQGNVSPSAQSTSNPLQVAFPGNTTANSLIVAAGTFGGVYPSGTATCTDTLNNTFTTIYQNDSTNSQAGFICYAVNTNGVGSDTVKATFTPSTSFEGLAIAEYSGVTTSSPLDTSVSNSAVASTATDSITSTAATTANDGDLIIGGIDMTSSTSPTLTAGTGFTMRQTNGNGSNQGPVGLEDKVQATAGSVSATATSSVGSSRYNMIMVAFKRALASTSLTDTFSNPLFQLSQTGALVLQNSTNSATSFVVNNKNGGAQLAVDTLNSRVVLGSLGGDSVGTLLVLGTKTTSGDPTGMPGAMYYNSNSNTFRCYENNAWKDCLSHHVITLTSDVTDSSGNCTFTAATGLSFAVASATAYRFHANIIYTSASTSTGLGLSVTGPASPTLISTIANLPIANTSPPTSTNIAVATASGYDAGGCSASTPSTASTGWTANLEGIVQPSANGTVQLDFASEVNNSAVVIKAGSTFEWW